MAEYLKKACIAILIFTFSNSLYAQPDSIDVFVKNVMQKRKIPGLQLAIVRHGKIIKTGNFAVVGVEPGSEATASPTTTLNSNLKIEFLSFSFCW